MGFIQFSHPALDCKLKTLPSLLLSIQYQISSHTVQTSQPLLAPLGIPRHKMRFIIIYVVGHKITETNCSWHKFIKPLFFLKIVYHLTINVFLKLTIIQPFSLAWQKFRGGNSLLFLICSGGKTTKTKDKTTVELQAVLQAFWSSLSCL